MILTQAQNWKIVKLSSFFFHGFFRAASERQPVLQAASSLCRAKVAARRVRPVPTVKIKVMPRRQITTGLGKELINAFRTGFISTPGMTVPLGCGRGFYCPSGSANQRPCPLGTYGNMSGLAEERQCTQCDPGMYCEETGTIQPFGSESPISVLFFLFVFLLLCHKKGN